MKGTRKRPMRLLSCLACLALLLLCGAGCGQSSVEETDTRPEQTVQEQPIWEDPTPEEIIQAMEESSDFAYGWFWDNVHVDHNDTIYDDAIMDGTCPCERVIEPGVTTKADVLELTKAYFTEDAAQRLLNQKEWIELEDALYVSATEGLGDGGMGNSMEVTVEKDSDTQYTVTIRELVNGNVDSWISEPYSVHYQYADGRWIFDDVVLVYGRPITLLKGTAFP